MATMQDAAIAAVRFGLGARPGEIEALARDPRAALKAQAGRAEAFMVSAAGLPTTADAGATLARYLEAVQEFRRAQRRSGAKTAENVDASKPAQPLHQLALREAQARIAQGLTTQTPYAERLALFWANHFTVSATKFASVPYVGVYEREAVRANLTKRFEDVLQATTRHPGMLLYLDQAQSVGPQTMIARRRDVGLNENLAREVLELHTVGAQGGYTQADVTEFAKALTGWTIVSARTQRFAPNGRLGEFAFIAALHEPGARTVMGRRYPEEGEAQAGAILRDLAAHPATAKRVATKLARHLIADEPPPSAVATLERTFLDTGGDLPALHRAAVDLGEAWSPELRKVKTPNEFMMSALRLVGLTEVDPRSLVAAYAVLGQTPYRAPSPEGWPDTAADWAAPDALMKRLEWSQALGARIGERARPEDVAARGLGPLLTPRTAEAIRRAENPAQGFALALMSPEFQRR